MPKASAAMPKASAARPRLRYACYDCDAEVVAPLSSERATCPACSRVDPLERAIEDGRLVRCPLCGCPDFYLTRAFPPVLGVAIVLAAALASFVVYGVTDSPYSPLLPLGAAVVADWILYALTPPLVVCYLCRAFLEAVPTDGIESFDSEKGLSYEFARERRENRRAG